MYLTAKPRLGILPIQNENSDLPLRGISRVPVRISVEKPVSTVAPVITPVYATPVQPAPIPIVTAHPPAPSIPSSTAVSVVQGGNAVSKGTAIPVSETSGQTPQAPAVTAGTPVPAGFPTNTTYVAADGSQWIFNATTNAWVYGGSATGGSSSVPTAAGTAASVTAPAAATSDYQALLDWLSVSDTTALISSVPNWITALGAALLLYKVSQGKGKR